MFQIKFYHVHELPPQSSFLYCKSRQITTITNSFKQTSEPLVSVAELLLTWPPHPHYFLWGSLSSPELSSTFFSRSLKIIIHRLVKFEHNTMAKLRCLNLSQISTLKPRVSFSTRILLQTLWTLFSIFAFSVVKTIFKVQFGLLG